MFILLLILTKPNRSKIFIKCILKGPDFPMGKLDFSLGPQDQKGIAFKLLAKSKLHCSKLSEH